MKKLMISFRITKVAQKKEDGKFYVRLYSEGEAQSLGILKIKSKGITYFMGIEELPENVQLSEDEYGKMVAKGEALAELPEIQLEHTRTELGRLIPVGFTVSDKEMETDNGTQYFKWIAMTR